MAEVIPGRVHRHFKGDGKRYYVLLTATHTETKEDLVIYVPLYGENAGIPLARPRKMWEEEVKDRRVEDGSLYSGDRFWPLPQAKPNLG